MKQRKELRLLLSAVLICTLLATMAILLIQQHRPAKAAGNFSVNGTQIIDPNGNPFVIHGTNINGPNWNWPRDMSQDADMIANVWKFNFVRVMSNIYPGSGTSTDNNDTDKLVNAFTSRGVVVMFVAHDWTGQEPQGQGLTDLTNWLTGLANRYKDNPYVWLDTYNEPFGCDNNGVSSNWLTVQTGLISAIRNTGFQNVISPEGTQWASDEGTSNGCYDQNGFVADNQSALLTYGQQLTSQFSNLAFQIHMYCWGTADKMNNFFDRVAAKNLTVFIGEYGIDNGSGCDGKPTIQALFNVAPQRNIGRVVWHWFGGDGNYLVDGAQHGGYLIDRTDGSRPGNLSWLGGYTWDDNHGSGGGGGGGGGGGSAISPAGRFGTDGINGSTYDKASDGDMNTAFDAVDPTNCYTGIDAGSAVTLTQIAYSPRYWQNVRMPGGVFQGASSQDGPWTTVYTIPSVPDYGVMTKASVSPGAAYQFYRYVGPTDGHCNIGEMVFYQ